MTSRRNFLFQGSAVALSLLYGNNAFSEDNAASLNQLQFGSVRPFSFETLAQTAQIKSLNKYVEVINPNTPILEKLGYSELGELRYKTQNALFVDNNLYPITFFHMGNFFRNPVKMYTLEAQDAHLFSREVMYSETYFDIPENSHAKQLKSDMGFAGFKIQELHDSTERWKNNDWVAFLGASYFRAIGSLQQYGLSARALAIDTGLSNKKEDFPNFTEFYFAPQSGDNKNIVIYALLEGRTVVGAYKFTLSRGVAVDMEVEAKIFVRESITRFGVAPLTSMYWYSEASKKPGGDWRPEIHDSDGLSVLNGAGEYLWRPLNNPKQVSASAFSDNQPKGFGLLQRDRNFENYLDGVHYEKRPNLWVEPISGFGVGSVQLIEIPTPDETNDNIVACWVPEKEMRAGDTLDIHYKLYWGDIEKISTTRLAKCISTRTGFGGQPGQVRKDNLTKFVVEFQGDILSELKDKPEIILESAGGAFSTVMWERVPYSSGKTDRVRIQFDFELQQTTADIKLYLKNKDTVITETWVYQLQK